MPAHPVGACAHWEISMLQTLATTSTASPTHDRGHDFRTPHERSSSSTKHKLSVVRKGDMGAASAHTLRRKQAIATPKSKQKRPSKGDLQASSYLARRLKVSTQNYGRSPPKVNCKQPAGLGTRVGTSRDAPIIIEDDDGEHSDFRIYVRQQSGPLSNSSLASATPQHSLKPSQGLYGDEIMVKIDPNDAFLEWDTDAPPPPDRYQKRTGLEKFAAIKSRSWKPKAGPYRQSELLRSPQRTSFQSSRYQPTISVSSTSHPQNGDRRRRRNSITDTFVVPDNVVYLDTDISSSDIESSNNSFDRSDSDIETVNTVPEYTENMRINMLPRYAYTDGISGRSKKK